MYRAKRAGGNRVAFSGHSVIVAALAGAIASEAVLPDRSRTP